MILHKLLEEILSKELVNENEAVAARATILTNQLSSAMKEGAKLPDPTEMAQTVARTLRIPEVSAFMDQLIPEFPVYGMLEGADMTALSGRVDAFTLSDDGRVDIVVDWKSDVNPTESVVQQHSAQLLDYMTVLDAGRGALVYMTPGSVRWLTRRP